MGNEAVANGLDTLDLAKLHDQALTLLISANSSADEQQARMRRADEFFAEASLPVEATHRAVREAAEQLNQVNEELRRCAAELADTERELQRVIHERRSAEAALRTVAELPAHGLEDCRRLETSLQDKARSILAANEEERKKMSIKLHDEIAQALLGIHMRLLTLHKKAAASQGGMNDEIVATRRSVEAAMNTINRFSEEFGTHHES